MRMKTFFPSQKQLPGETPTIKSNCNCLINGPKKRLFFVFNRFATKKNNTNKFFCTTLILLLISFLPLFPYLPDPLSHPIKRHAFWERSGSGTATKARPSQHTAWYTKSARDRRWGDAPARAKPLTRTFANLCDRIRKMICCRHFVGTIQMEVSSP